MRYSMSILVFAIILMGKRELVALIYLSSWCLVVVVWLFLTKPWVCLLFVIVAFPDYTITIFEHQMEHIWFILPSNNIHPAINKHTHKDIRMFICHTLNFCFNNLCVIIRALLIAAVINENLCANYYRVKLVDYPPVHTHNHTITALFASACMLDIWWRT